MKLVVTRSEVLVIATLWFMLGLLLGMLSGCAPDFPSKIDCSVLDCPALAKQLCDDGYVAFCLPPPEHVSGGSSLEERLNEHYGNLQAEAETQGPVPGSDQERP